MPYFDHPQFRLPAGKTIWRYMDFTKFVSLLGSKALYFASMLRMSELDAFEGLYTRADIAMDERIQRWSFDEIPEMWRKSFGDKEAWERFKSAKVFEHMRIHMKHQRAITYVNCWHMNPNESAAMWKVYLKSDEGIAIRSSTDRLKECFRNYQDFEINIGEVTYVDYESHVMSRVNGLEPSLHKRLSFEHEHELRALIWGAQHGKMNMNNTEGAPSGLSVTVDLETLVEEVYASPKAEQWFVDLINSVCKDYDLDKKVIPSDLAGRICY